MPIPQTSDERHIQTLYADESTGEPSVLIPRSLAKQVGLDIGSKVELEVINGAIVILLRQE